MRFSLLAFAVSSCVILELFQKCFSMSISTRELNADDQDNSETGSVVELLREDPKYRKIITVMDLIKKQMIHAKSEYNDTENPLSYVSTYLSGRNKPDQPRRPVRCYFSPVPKHIDSRKVPLAPGRSLVDWVRKTNGLNLSGTTGNLKVTEEDMVKHSRPEDAWTILRGRIYNLTPYIEYHPGGVSELMKAAGIDATDLFNEVHCWVNLEGILKSCLVGFYVGSCLKKNSLCSNMVTANIGLLSIDSSLFVANREYNSYEIESVESISHNTLLFALKCTISVPIGHHIYVRRKIRDVWVSRPYTPVLNSFLSADNNSSLMHLMVKIYSDGLLTSEIGRFKSGDCMQVSNEEGNFDNSMLQEVNVVIMLAAGTGLTPLVKLTDRLLLDNKKVLLIFFNKQLEDILWKDKLDALEEQTKGNFRRVYVLSQPDSNWVGYKGLVSKGLLRQCEVLPSPNSFVCYCGPSGFMDTALRSLEALGWQQSSLHAFKG